MRSHCSCKGSSLAFDVLGAEFGPMFRNMARNLEEDRIRVIQGVWARD